MALLPGPARMAAKAAFATAGVRAVASLKGLVSGKCTPVSLSSISLALCTVSVRELIHIDVNKLSGHTGGYR